MTVNPLLETVTTMRDPPRHFRGEWSPTPTPCIVHMPMYFTLISYPVWSPYLRLQILGVEMVTGKVTVGYAYTDPVLTQMSQDF